MATSGSVQSLPVGLRGLTKEFILQAVKRYRQIVAERGNLRTPGAKLPKATDMRAYRFCIQDVVLAIWAKAHRKETNCIEVDVFLTSEVYDSQTGERGFYDELAGATAATLVILSEGFRVGIPLRVRFTKNVEGGRVPMDIMQLAHRHGVTLTKAEEGIIDPDEGRELYLALTGFRPSIRRAVQMLAGKGLLTPERAGYIVHHGVWSLPEVEGILLCSTYPDLVLSGDVQIEQRHLYQHVQTHARLALMGGLLDRSLQARDYDRPSIKPADAGATVGIDMEDDDRDIDIRTHARFRAREYVLLPPSTQTAKRDTMPLPWHEQDLLELQPGQRLCALLRPRVSASLEAMLPEDFTAAVDRKKVEPIPDVVAVVVPFDFNDLPKDRQTKFHDEARRQKIELLICPETTRAMDQLAIKKMQASRIRKE